MSTERAARFPWWAYFLFLVMIVLFAVGPLLSAISASLIAEAHGCMLNEAGVNPCLVAGLDIGEWLVFMFIMGWFSIATLPLGGGALVVWLASLIIHRIAWGQMQKVKRL